MSLTSCTKIDNWDGPDAQIHGRVIDSYTGENILSSQGEWGIRIWERSWTESVPTDQSLPVKQDGSYNNTKVFSGTYDMLPYGGPFWPVDTVKNVVFNGNSEQDFTVTPYLQIIDFETKLDGLKLMLKCRLKAPIRDGLPNLVEIKPFLSLNEFCGATSFIDNADYDNTRIQINRSWADEVGDADTSGVYYIGPLQVNAGYTYNVRLGANVNDANQHYNYSNVVNIEVPEDAVNDTTEVDNYLSNAAWPFSRSDWDGTRWGNLSGGWVTNAAMRSRGDGQYGGYDGGWTAGTDEQSLGFEYWGDSETPIVDGKLYQTLDLPAGDYRFTLSFAGDNPIVSNSGDDPRYIVVAAGETLPDIDDVSSSSLGYKSFAGLGTDGATSFVFSLDAPTKVAVGLVVNFTDAQQNVRLSWLKVERIY